MPRSPTLSNLRSPTPCNLRFLGSQVGKLDVHIFGLNLVMKAEGKRA